ALSESRLLLRVGRLRLLHARHVTFPEPVVADRRRDGDHGAGDVGVKALLTGQMCADKSLRLRTHVVRPRVQAEHPDGPRALLAGIGVLAIRGPPAGGAKYRAEEILDEPCERPLCRVADRVVREPRQRVGYRGEYRAILFATELFDPTKECGERCLAMTDERPEVVEERETLLGGEMRDAFIEQIAFERRGEAESVEAASAAIRKEPPGVFEAQSLAFPSQHEALLFRAAGCPVLEHEGDRPHLTSRLGGRVRGVPLLGQLELGRAWGPLRAGVPQGVARSLDP